MPDELITVDSSKDLRFEGSFLSGSVNLNTLLAKEKDITAVRISLKGQIHTWIQINTGQSSYRVADTEPIFKIENSLWSADSPVPDHPYATINLPFSFTVPNTVGQPLPASLHCGNWSRGARIQYYVHVIADKKAWYKRNTRINVPFPLLPLDRTSAPTLQLDNWSGPWTKLESTVSVRSNVFKLFGASGSVSASLQLPEVDSLPLYTRIPCRVHVICSSRLLSSSHSLDPTSFTFPRNPKMTDIKLELIQRNRIKAKVHRESFNESYGLLGGFGSLDNLASIQTEMTEPIWVSDEGKADKGRWVESVTYIAHLILRCPTPIQTRLVQSEIKINAKISFPGIGNSWKATLGPLSVSSGIASPEQGNNNPGYLDITVPPSYWDVMGDDNGDVKADKKEKEKEND